MYQCNECGRKYARQNSLTRHLHNHRKTKRHVCPICNAVFYRGDLLSRHVKLHDGTITSYQESTVRGQNTRRRCHTACGRCREHRTKCNGQHPCHTCTKANKEVECEYNRDSNRLSHIRTASEDSSALSIPRELDDPTHSDSAGNRGDGDEQADSQSQTHQSRLLPTLDDVSAGNRDSAIHHPRPEVQHTALPSNMNFQVAMGGNIAQRCSRSIQEPPPEEVAMYFDPHNTISWPWLHESLYLSNTQKTLLDSVNSANMMGPTSNVLSNPFIPDQDQHNAQNFQFHDISGEGSNLQNLPYASSLGSGAQELLLSQQDLCGAHIDDPKQAEQSYSRQMRVVNELVVYSIAPIDSNNRSSDHSMFWHSVSPKLAAAFHIHFEYGPSSSSILQHFIDLYLKHFGPLWPLLTPQDLKVDHLHPMLYLVLTSIGAMYGGAASCIYGTMIHNSIRTQLTSAFELDDFESDFTWLAQARLLIQVAALYFGQPKAFSYAQHLGALLVAQARRMDLFSAAYAESSMARFHQLSGMSSDSNRLAIWLHLETRRRLAFGIFRGDTYTSVLLHVKPLVCLEEIDLELPSCDAVWRAEKMSPQVCLYMIEHDRTPSRDIKASDIYRIALDPDETLPLLDPSGHELLLFGLQWPLWRFSRDQKVFERLTGQDRDCLVQQQDAVESPESVTRSVATGVSSSGIRSSKSASTALTRLEADCLDSCSRKMSDFAFECGRFMAALRKWEQALSQVKKLVHTEGDRSSLLSSLVLYHLGYLRLYAPIQDLHQIQYRLANGGKLEAPLIHSVWQWANSSRARLAAKSACSIWSLINTESRKAQNTRVRFNLLAFTGLHHGAVLLWSYMGARDLADDMQSGAPPLFLETSDDTISKTMVTSAESSNILSSFVTLYDLISPARWSSFAQAANTLSKLSFPSLD